ncbi:MAG: preprotein translocase subunit SecE [Firmicutes bacterium ADurb.BinA205]|nr:MAG: preprotein translocase subunit SecE [Firmicutes bacterium ADurb.BinA205]
MAKNKKKKSTSEKSEKETKKVALDKAEDVVDDIKEAKKSKKEESAVSESKESKKSKKDKDTDKKEPNKLAKWFKDLRIEFKKVVWPSKETVVTNTSVVVGVIALSAILVGLLDEGFLALMRLIYR